MQIKKLKTTGDPRTVKMEAVFWSALVEGEVLGILNRYHLSLDDFDIEFLNNPHTQPPLPAGKAAMMLFFHENKCLLVGFAGANSNARFQTQHYYKAQKGMSSLAGYLLRDRRRANDADEFTIRDWMMQHCWRINIYVDSGTDTEFLKMFSNFLRTRFGPCYGKRRT